MTINVSLYDVEKN